MPSYPQRLQRAQLGLEKLDSRNDASQGLPRLIKQSPCENACLHRPHCARRQPLGSGQPCPNTPPKLPAAQLALLSYLAELTTQTPPPLIVGLLAPERHHRILIVRRSDVLVSLVPLPALLAVPRLLAAFATAGHLPVTNSWIWNERTCTMKAAAPGCFFHPSMVLGKHPAPLLFVQRRARATSCPAGGSLLASRPGSILASV